MASQGTERRLAAILNADVVGYSRLMAENEDATVQTVTAYHEQIGVLVRQHRGRVVDAPGDNLLAEFSTATDAVEAAAEIQRVIKARNAAIPEGRKMEFRIGVHLGEVRVEGERIYGDGVNIAARLEGLADPGGICISDDVLHLVQGKLELDFDDLGEQTLKNIERPVRAFRVVPPTPAAGDELELPDKPSIAVLPFTNMSGDPEQEYCADGITEDLITDLSKASGLFVISRNSSFTYKGRAVNVSEVGRDLGVRYVLEGSVRKAGNRVRITAQLVEAATGGHVWAERYDRELTDVFAVQDEVTKSIVVEALQVSLTEGERTRIEGGPTENLEAYDEYLRGLWCMEQGLGENFDQARAHLERALELDPYFAAAHSAMARTYLREWMRRLRDWDAMEQGLAHARKAVELDPSLARGHSTLGGLLTFAGEHDQGIAEIEKAISLDSNDAEVLLALATALNFSGRNEEALTAIQRAIRLDPHTSDNAYFRLAVVQNRLGRTDEAIASFERVHTMKPQFWLVQMNLVALYGHLGDDENAKRWLADLRRLQPDFSLASIPRLRFRRKEDREYLPEGLRKAGVKEE